MSADCPPDGSGLVMAVCGPREPWRDVAAESVRSFPDVWFAWRPRPDTRVRDTATEPPPREGYILVWHAGVGAWFTGLGSVVAQAPARYPHWLPMPPAPGGAHATT